MAWILYGCGFSPLVFTEKDGPILTKVTSGAREICRIDYEPRLTVSSTWDACHIFMKKKTACESEGSNNKTSSLTLGRWSKKVDEVRRGLPQNENIRDIVEVGNQMILNTTTTTIKITCYHDNTPGGSTFDLQSDSCVDGLYCMEEEMFAHLENGQVFTGTLSKSMLKLDRPVLTGITMKKVACASNHILFLSGDNKGRVWSLGLNNRGQLGHGDILSRPHPSLVEALDGLGIMDVGCGSWHSLAVSEYGDVYSWGWNKDRQLGHSADSATIAIPTLVELEEGDVEFKMVECGSRHSAALSVCGKVYTWGWDGYGQLGHPKAATGPVAMVSEGVVSWIHCGPWTTLYLVTQ